MTISQNEFIDFLKGFQEWLDYDKNSNDYETGYRCASGCVNDVTRDYCELYIDQTKAVENKTLYMEDTISNIISVLEAALDYKTDNEDFNQGYKDKIQQTIKKLKEDT